MSKVLDETVENLEFIKEAINHYELALKSAFPVGASGHVFHHWNEARKFLGWVGSKPTSITKIKGGSMSKHTKGPWVIKKDMIYGNEGRESIACVLDGAWPHGLKPDSKANAHRIISCVNALEGLSNDALDGGWNFKSMSKYCKDIESQRNELLEALELLIDDLALRAKLRGDDCLDVSDSRLIKAQEAILKAKGK